MNTIPDLKAVLSTDRRTWNLVFDTDLSKVVSDSRKQRNDLSNVMSMIVKVCKIVGKDYIDQKYFFEGHFGKNCENEFSSILLVCLVEGLVEGNQLFDRDKSVNLDDSNRSLMKKTVVQTLQSNTILRRHAYKDPTKAVKSIYITYIHYICNSL